MMHATKEPEAKKKQIGVQEIVRAMERIPVMHEAERKFDHGQPTTQTLQLTTTMATNDERFDFEAVLSTQAKDWACASDLQNLTRWYHPRPLL
jgi:hypothetical protein